MIKDDHSIDKKSKRWEHNIYMGLMTTDEYVWGYFEEVNWWNTTASDQPMGNTVSDPPPAWIEKGISRAWSKYKNLSPPGWDMQGEIWSDGTLDSTLSVKIISPRQGDLFTAKQSIPVVAEIVNAGDTAVCQVDFYINMIKVGQVSQAPWSFQSSNLPPGVYDMVVRAHAGIKITGTSAPIRISVKPLKN